jgi:hypothetical protein
MAMNYNLVRIAHLSTVIQQRLLKNYEKSLRRKPSNSDTWMSETQRRKVVLSRESRFLHLYQMFLKGRTVEEVEQNTRPQTLSYQALIFRYMPSFVTNEDLDEFISWIGDKKVYPGIE